MNDYQIRILMEGMCSTYSFSELLQRNAIEQDLIRHLCLTKQEAKIVWDAAFGTKLVRELHGVQDEPSPLEVH